MIQNPKKYSNPPRFNQKKINSKSSTLNFHSIPKKKKNLIFETPFRESLHHHPSGNRKTQGPFRIYLVNWDINSVPLQNPEEFLWMECGKGLDA